MWLFTKDGFFSAAQDDYCSANEVMIRARAKQDLVRMLKALRSISRRDIPKNSAILKLDYADYRYRVKLKKALWALYCKHAAYTIDYSTVKDNICPDKDRKPFYYQIWNALWTWQYKKERLQDEPIH